MKHKCKQCGREYVSLAEYIAHVINTKNLPHGHDKTKRV